MNSRSLSILAAALAFLIAGSALFWFLSRPAKSESLISELVPLKAVRLEISGPSGNFTFAKSGPAWHMQTPVPYPTDPNSFQQSVDKLGDLTLSEELSSDPSHYDVFSLSDSSATHVRLYTPNATVPDLDFYIGKEGSDYGTFYMRRAGRPSVVQASGCSSREFTKLAGDWLDKIVIGASSGTVTHLSIRSAKNSARLKRTGNKWTLDTGRVLSTSTLEQTLQPMLDRLAHFDADRVLLPSELPPPGKTGLSKPEMTIEIGLQGLAQPVTLKIGKKDERGYYYIEKAGETRVYFMAMEWKIAVFEKKL